MKKLIWSYVLFTLVIFLLCTGVHLLLDFSHNKDIDIFSVVFRGFIFSVPCFGVFLTIIYGIFSNFKYLESDDMEAPSSKIIRSLSLHRKIDFIQLKEEISKNWYITYINEREKTLKFRNRITCFTNGFEAGGCLKYDEENNMIYVSCFSMTGIQNRRLAEKMATKVSETINQM